MNLTGPTAREYTQMDRIELAVDNAIKSFEALYARDLANCSLTGPAAALWSDLRRAKKLCEAARS
jgi:hypothetical protein